MIMIMSASADQDCNWLTSVYI